MSASGAGDDHSAGGSAAARGSEAARSRCSTERRSSTGLPTRAETLLGDIASNAISNAACGALDESAGTTKEGMTFSGAVVTLVVNCTGVGLVLFPKIMAEVGIIMAPVLCAVCALTCLECGVMICGACAMAEKLLGVERIQTYEGLAEAIGGASGKRFIMVTKNFALLGIIVAYMQLMVDSLAAFFPGASESTKLAIRFGVALPAFGLLALLRDLRQLAKLSGLGVLAVLVEVGGILVGGLYLGTELPLCEDGRTGDEQCLRYDVMPEAAPSELLSTSGKYLAVFLFGYAILATVPSLRSQLAEPGQMHAILSRSFAILVVINCTVMGCGYFGFGDRAPDNIIAGLAERLPTLGKAASAAIVVNVLISAPLNIFCVITAFEARGTDELHTPMTVPNIFCRLGLIAALSGIGAVLPYITEIIGIVSSVFSCCNNILFPMTFHYLGRQQAGMPAKNPLWRQVKYFSAMVVGFIVLVFGFLGSVTTLLQKMELARLASLSGSIDAVIGEDQ